MKHVGYYVRYRIVSRNEANPLASGPIETSIVLRDFHPVAWAGDRSAFVVEQKLHDELISWQEFDCPDHLWHFINTSSFFDTADLDGAIEGARLDAEATDSPEHRRSEDQRRYERLLALRAATK